MLACVSLAGCGLFGTEDVSALLDERKTASVKSDMLRAFLDVCLQTDYETLIEAVPRLGWQPADAAAIADIGLRWSAPANPGEVFKGAGFLKHTDGGNLILTISRQNIYFHDITSCGIFSKVRDEAAEAEFLAVFGDAVTSHLPRAASERIAAAAPADNGNNRSHCIATARLGGGQVWYSRVQTGVYDNCRFGLSEGTFLYASWH